MNQQHGDLVAVGLDIHRDFFISHASDDQQWAEWIGQQLVNAGYTIELAIWEWTAGQDFVAGMDTALQRAERVIAVYTDAYFSRPYAQAEHRAAFTATVAGRPGRVLPVRVEDCEIPELYASLVRIELVGLDEAAAAHRLIDGIIRAAGPPARKVAFPGTPASNPTHGAHSASSTQFPRRPPRLWSVPRRNPFFVGRNSLLDQIHRLLHPAGDGDRDRAVGLVPLQGMGGVGKTQLAVEYAHRYGHEYQLVWWLDADNRVLNESGLTDLAGALGLPVAGPRAAVIRQLWGVLSQRTDWLLIYDNVDDPSDLADLQPPDSGCLLVTSRSPTIARFAPTLVEISEFSRSESVLLLGQYCPTLSPDDADRLAVSLGDLPLAVAQAGCFLAETGLTVSAYLRLLAGQPEAAGLADPTIDRHPGLASVVAASRDRLKDRSPAAVALLDQMAFLAPEPLPFTPRGTEPGPERWGVQVGDPATTTQLVRQLTGVGLARRLGTSLQLHRLVQALLRSRLSPQEESAARLAAQRLLATADIGRLDETDSYSWPAYAALTPHVEALVDQLEDNGEAGHDDFRRLVIRTACYLDFSNQIFAGRRLGDRMLSLWRRLLGPDHPDTLCMARIYGGHLVELSGDLAIGRDLLKDTLARQRRVLGEDHHETLLTAGRLGYALRELGELEAARELHEYVLGSRQRSLGNDHPETLHAANYLGLVFTTSGEYQAACALHEDALVRRRRLLGEDHPDTLRSANNLGIALRGLGDHAAARDLHRDALDRARARLGPVHFVTFYSAMQLAVSLVGLGHRQPARDLLVEALAVSEALGGDNPDIQAAVRHLAEIDLVCAKVGEEAAVGADADRAGSRPPA
jgi:tetratricopeptide (TPR) repeat protein